MTIDGDKLIRASTAVVVTGVAIGAAVISYNHIYDLGRAHGGSGTAARLLPLSVDMLILVGELMLLHEADVKGRRFVLGWVLVWSGILATLAANVSYGAQYGITGAIIWGWPAYSFILAAGGMVAVVKRGAVRDDDAGLPMDSEPGPEMSRAVQREPAPSMDKPPVKRVDKPQSRQVPVSMDGAALSKAMDLIRSNPGITNAEVVRQAKVSVKTVTRARKELKLNGAKS